MSHLSSELIADPEADVLSHLESCNRCRSLVSSDVDVDVVWQQILGEVAKQPASSSRSRQQGRSTPWYGRPVAVASITAGAVILLMAPVAWLGLQDGDDSTQQTQTPPVTAATAPSVVLPERPDEAMSNQPSPPVPGPVGEVGSFEMEFVSGDTVIGRLIWNDPTFYELYTANITLSGPEFGYHMYRAGTDFGRGGLDEEKVFSDDSGRQLPEDPAVPWDLLVNPRSTEDQWAAIAGPSIERTAVEPTHPHAAQAWEVGDIRLEVTAEGIPVVINRPGHPEFEVTGFESRTIRVGEVGNGSGLPFKYALHLSKTTTDAQYPVLSEGVVTFDDYRTAAEKAAACSGTELRFDESIGMYEFAAGAADCAARYVDDIAAVWRLDSQWVPSSEWTEISYLVAGEAEAAAMYQADVGPQRPLASGAGWAISIAERGPGVCTYESAMGFGEGCFVPSQMLIPTVLNVSVGVSFDNGNAAAGSIMGVVTESADRIIVTFSNGGETAIAPGHLTQFGLRGYGMIFNAGELGVPSSIAAYSGSSLLGETDLDPGALLGNE